MNAHRIASIAAAAAIALAATQVTGCGTSGPAVAPTTTDASSAGSAPAGVNTSTEPAAAANQTIRVTYAGGKATGDTGKIPVAVGAVVELVVTSDVADEVHVHGYDLSAQVPAGGTATVDFTADIPGGFEVELEQLGFQLLELQVS
jgi:hypothetical protein